MFIYVRSSQSHAPMRLSNNFLSCDNFDRSEISPETGPPLLHISILCLTINELHPISPIMQTRMKIKAPLEAYRIDNAGLINRTRIKRCSKCKKFKPDYAYRPTTRNLDGLHSTCSDCVSIANRGKKQSPEVYNGYYDDNPMYYKMMAKSNRLAKRARQTLLEIEQQELRHRASYPDAPFRTSASLFAEADLREARRLRKLAGTPTGRRPTTQ